MKLKKLNVEQLKNIYNNNMVKDFPKEELKKLKTIVRLFEAGDYFAYGAYRENVLVGYALFMTKEKSILLDYFAIVEGVRNKGYGSTVINLICNELKDDFDIFILECENPKFSRDDDEKKMRESRIKFYERNGFIKSNVKAKVFGNEFITLISKNSINNKSEVATCLYNIYVAMSNEEICSNNVFVEGINY